MRKISTVIAFLMVLLVFSNSITTSFAEQETKMTPSGIEYSQIGGRINAFIAEREAGLASCALSVFNGDGVIFDGYYGYSNMEDRFAANAETVYEWGSCSKILVWVSVMQQWERGNLDLNADIRGYLPEGFLTKLQYPDEKITMLHLMNHNAGFQESFYENQEADPDAVYDTLEEAVRACECYQAYHVGEYTAYSNWGTALAAYIVERTSGMDYVAYVHQNIFAPLGMKHTCIDPKLRDNAWVETQRSKLKCYLVNTDTQDNYGECRYGVQLFPAGSAIGTLEDFATFAQAFVAKECPLFEKAGTRDEMLSATSIYGDNTTAKNCHGLWTGEYLVQTLGHAGNTGGCSCNFVFEPKSGLGIVIMTNELGETAFNYGIPGLLFGSVTDREEYLHSQIPSGVDVSGVYYSRRSIVSGAAKAVTYLGGIMPWAKEENETYAMKLFGLTLDDSTKLVPINEHAFVMRSNDMEMFMYIDGHKLEMMSSDYVKDSAIGIVACLGFVLLGIGCIIALLIRMIVMIVRRRRGIVRKHTAADRQVLIQQIIYGISGVIFVLFIVLIAKTTPVFLKISCMLAAMLGMISLVNGSILCYNTVKFEDKISTGIKQYLWVVLSVAYAAFIVIMQLYCFWKL